MTGQQSPSKLGRIIALVLMGLTVFFTLMGGIGTTCVALGAEKYDSMAGLVPYKPLYQLIVVLSIAVGIWGIPVMIALVRGGNHAHRNALIVLGVGAVTSGVQTAVSQAVRGSSAPANVRFAVTLVTLIVFLIFRLPGLWRRMRFDEPLRGQSAKTAGGVALAVCGSVTLFSPVWVTQTHLSAWLLGLRIPLIVTGLVLLAVGTALLAVEMRYNRCTEMQEKEMQPA
ncbi:MAG: hypothetical protein JXC32_19265 [Anaerolineae bacterium]|nr:hypothetical protein [Anaerolineae bacterium]